MKNVEFNQTNLKLIARSLASKVQRYAIFVFAISLLTIYGFLIVQISMLSQVEPTEEEITQQTGTIKRLKLDQTSIDKIKQLEEVNVEVKSIFKQARDNPFQD